MPSSDEEQDEVDAVLCQWRCNERPAAPRGVHLSHRCRQWREIHASVIKVSEFVHKHDTHNELWRGGWAYFRQ